MTLLYVLLENERLAEVGKVTYEYRLRHKDGTYHWISEGSMLVKDDSRRPVELFGYPGYHPLARADETNRRT